jgi:L-histidine Nalpha-methyltransferase
MDTSAERLGGADVLEDATDSFRNAVLAGLTKPRKAIPSKFFYDAEGSQLFEEICELDEYYPTRTEIALLAANAKAIAAELPQRALLVEFGSGASVKVRLLLDALGTTLGYIPIDISRDHLLDSARSLALDYPGLRVCPVCADFTVPFRLPSTLPKAPRIGFFPGSTIGNFHPSEAVRILRQMARALGSTGRLLIGVDLKKDSRILYNAYNDRAGVTAAFNTNLLRRINRELGGTFKPETFMHRAFYDAEAGRVEMHLVSRQQQVVHVDGRSFRFAEGESIHTENSYKYSVEEFATISKAAGCHPIRAWVDAEKLFSVHLLAIAPT